MKREQKRPSFESFALHLLHRVEIAADFALWLEAETNRPPNNVALLNRDNVLRPELADVLLDLWRAAMKGR